MKLFVYGTLKDGCGNHQQMRVGVGSKKVAKATIKGKLYDMGLPCYVMDFDNPTDVHGEVYEILDSVLLERLDNFEGYNKANIASSLYVRSVTEATLEDGTKEDVYVYEFNRDVNQDRQLKLGVW